MRILNFELYSNALLNFDNSKFKTSQFLKKVAPSSESSIELLIFPPKLGFFNFDRDWLIKTIKLTFSFFQILPNGFLNVPYHSIMPLLL